MQMDSFRGCFRVAWPLMLSMAANALMLFADRLFLARWSETSIQAALPAGFIAFTIIAFLQSLVAYSGTFVAQYCGSGARAACARAMGQGVWLSLLSIPLLGALIPVGNWIFTISGHAPQVIAEEQVYYVALMIGNMFVPFIAALSGFFTGRGFTRLVMVSSIVGNVVNVILDPLLIWGWGGFPQWGILGAGIATGIGLVVTLLILLVAVGRERHFASLYRCRVTLCFQPKLLLRIVGFGLPSGGHTLIDVSTFTIFVFLTGRLDAMSFSASNIALSMNHLIFAPLMGLGMGATILVGQFQGERNAAAAARSVRRCVTLGWLYIALMTALLLLFAGPVLALFYPANASFTFEAFAQVGWKLIIIFLLWSWGDTLNIIAGGALKGAGDTRFVIGLTSLVAFGLWMPMVFIVYGFGWGIVALWWTLPSYVLILAIGFTWRFLRGKWKEIEVI